MTRASAAPISANDEAIRAWDGPLFERFVRYRHLVTTGLAVHGEVALGLHPPAAGDRVLDLGCGFGDTTRRLAGIVGASSEALGVDAAANFIEASRREAREAGVTNARFAVADVQSDALGEGFDYAFSRFGTMFFANPVVALRNVRAALRPGARLVMVVWRHREDNDWIYRAQQIVERIVERPEEYDEPTCGPGPFSMANADTVSDVLLHAGYGEVELRRCDLPIKVGRDLDEAISLVTALGPAGEILRLAGDRAADLHDEVDRKLHEGMAGFVTDDGVWAAASTWVVAARVPE
ncbi:MAG TPA: class I SAM-dependent methyltransferase [Solirubrobacteraceae bacterium]